MCKWIRIWQRLAVPGDFLCLLFSPSSLGKILLSQTSLGALVKEPQGTNRGWGGEQVLGSWWCGRHRCYDSWVQGQEDEMGKNRVQGCWHSMSAGCLGERVTDMITLVSSGCSGEPLRTQLDNIATGHWWCNRCLALSRCSMCVRFLLHALPSEMERKHRWAITS